MGRFMRFAVMFKLVFLLSALIFVFSPFVYAAQNGQGQGNGSLPNGRPFQYIQTQIQSLEVMIEDLVGDVSGLEEFRDAAEAAIARLEFENVEIKAQIDGLSEEINKLQTQIDVNKDEIASLTSQVSSNALSITTLQSEIEGLQAQITANEGDIDTLQSQVNSHLTSIISLQNDINNANNRITNLQKQDSLLQAQITTNEDSIVNLSESITGNSTLIAELTTRVDQAEVALTQKQNRVSDICGAGSSIREIREDGSVVCEPDDVGAGTNPDFDVVVVTDLLTLDDGSVADPTICGDITLDCPSGYFVTGGYYILSGFTIIHPYTVYESRQGGPITGNNLPEAADMAVQAWYVRACHTTILYNISWQVYGVCIKVE